MQLAQKLAETIGRVQDPLMRGEVANRASARIGVPISDFSALLAKSRQRFTASDEDANPRPRIPRLPERIATLCLLALRDAEARQFLLSQNWREILESAEGSEILIRILESNLDPDNVASISAFTATLTLEQEALVNSWLIAVFKDHGGEIQHRLPRAMRVVQDTWRNLKEVVLRRQLQIAEGRLRLPRLSAGEQMNLQKQILDLTDQLRELSAFSPARVLDN
jgi:DNA primase